MSKLFSPTALSTTLSLQIADQIATAITEEQFAPGARIQEVNLAKAFNVSRATVRDALRILESRRLVNILPQRGARVTLLSLQELDDLFEIRAVLLALASRRAAGSYSTTDDHHLKNALAQLKRSINHPNAYARASASMVSTIAQLSKNDQLIKMIESFAQRIGRYARLGLVTQERRDQSLINWTSLCQSISDHNEDLAETIHRRLALENRNAAMLEITNRANTEQNDPAKVRKPRAKPQN